MAKTYSFLPDFSVFENDEQSDVSTEDTGSSIMSRNRQVDTDTSGTGGDFLERFYRNLRAAFNDDDKFKQTFMPNKRPKPNRAEIEEYINKSTRAKGIEDALFDATGTYKTGTPSDAGIMPLEDAPDGITVPKQPEIQVEELSSAGSTGSIGEYLRTRMNKGSSFVGEGVEVADTSKLTTEQVDLAKRLAAKRRMEADAAQMNVPVADMEEEERKALEFAKTIPKLSTIKGEGLMVPKKEELEVEAAEAEAMGSPMEQPFMERPKAPKMAFVNRDGTSKGETERSVYQYAYEQGLQGDELRAFMAQTAKESSSFGTIKEYGYLKTKVNNSWVERTPAQIAAKLGGSAERKAAFNALANNKAFTEGTDAQKNKMIFDIYYDDQYRDEAFKLGNTEVGDGSKYRGRGYIQLTGRNNYRLIGEDIGEDLENNPQLMLDPEIAKRASVAWWKRNVRSQDPNYTDTKEITKLVNGGDTGLADRRKLFNTYKFAVGPQTSLRPSARPDTRIASN